MIRLSQSSFLSENIIINSHGINDSLESQLIWLYNNIVVKAYSASQEALNTLKENIFWANGGDQTGKKDLWLTQTQKMRLIMSQLWVIIRKFYLHGMALDDWFAPIPKWINSKLLLNDENR